MTQMVQDDNEHFRFFANSLKALIETYGKIPEDQIVERQKQQIERLVALETEFRETLIRHPWGAGIYRDFVVEICERRRNILTARPYFRERQKVFTASVSKALKARDIEALYSFHFNYRFILFVLKARRWNCRQGGKITRLSREILASRQELIEMNLPLAIQRARKFFNKTPRSHLTFMDFVSISTEGLAAAIDKFVLPYSKVFRSVAIGRMVGNFITEYSETLIHFYPADKRKIYRANWLLARQGSAMVDFEKLAQQVNEGVEDSAHLTTASEIADLMAAASTVSSDAATAPTDDGEDEGPAREYAAPRSSQPDVEYEDAEAVHATRVAFAGLDLVDQKMLRLSGVAL